MVYCSEVLYSAVKINFFIIAYVICMVASLATHLRSESVLAYSVETIKLFYCYSEDPLLTLSASYHD